MIWIWIYRYIDGVVSYVRVYLIVFFLLLLSAIMSLYCFMSTVAASLYHTFHTFHLCSFHSPETRYECMLLLLFLSCFFFQLFIHFVVRNLSYFGALHNRFFRQFRFNFSLYLLFTCYLDRLLLLVYCVLCECGKVRCLLFLSRIYRFNYTFIE